MKIEFSNDEIKTLWALVMAELSEEHKPIAMKLTKALKESAGGN